MESAASECARCQVLTARLAALGRWNEALFRRNDALVRPAASRGQRAWSWRSAAERAQLRAELDAAYFHLYGIARDDVEYILSTFTNTGLAPVDQRTTSRALWTRENTGALILDAYDRLASRPV